MRHPDLAAILLVGLATSAIADGIEVPFDNGAACMEGPTAQFGRYVGNWDIRDWQLDQDGQTWNEGQGARWNFACLGSGTAIQDFWLPPDGNVGTNLRTYNAETETWDIIWIINTLPGFSHITAKMNDDGDIVMEYVSPIPDPLRRITFFPPDDTGWNWKLEFSSDAGESWTEVYRIRATPAK